MSNSYYPESAMAIFAHPDDIEFGVAGTLARWAKQGTKISYVIITSGDAGIDNPEISREQAIHIRQEESRVAAEIAGASEVIFLGQPDGLLEATLDLRKILVTEIRRFKPEVVICGDPTVTLPSETYINHPDHRAAATAAIDAVFPASGQPSLFQEIQLEYGFSAHKPRKVYIQAWSEPTIFINISETIDLKIEALKSHKSQMNGWDPEPMIREWAAETAKGKEMEFAEGFKVITLVSDEDWIISNGDPIKLFFAKEEKRLAAQKDESGSPEKK